MAEIVRLTISQILKDLNNGLTRKDIAKKYNLPYNQVKVMFEHPKLKGKRTRAIRFKLIDDTTENVQEIGKPDNSQEEESKIDTSDIIDPHKPQLPDDSFKMNNNPLV